VTSEDDFQRQLDANPKDHHTRLVFADWLDERNDPRGPGYRALGRLRLWSLRLNNRSWWSSTGGGIPTHNHLPRDWFAAVAGTEYSGENWRWPDRFENNRNDRKEVEDAAALAFGKLPAERQAELLAPRAVTKRPKAKTRKARKPTAKKAKPAPRKTAAKKAAPRRKPAPKKGKGKK
jgi:uncharacterized protein (TIGR02996 family)